MFGAIGTVLVISQMAGLAFNVNPTIVMIVGLIGAISWIIHSIQRGDKWLLTVNSVVAAFAAFGIIT